MENSIGHQREDTNARALVRGIRGAIDIAKNDRNSILSAAQLLLEKMTSKYQIAPEDIVWAFFTTTRDINAEFPAAALRKLGWSYVPALCAHEMEVPQSMPFVIRILILAYTGKKQKEINHQYLGKTSQLRPDF